MVQGPSLCVDVVEIGQPLQKRSEMGRGERALETTPTRGLRFICASQRVENIDPSIFPFKIGPVPAAVALAVLGRFNRLPCLLDPAGCKQAVGDFSGNLRYLPDFFV